MPAGQCARDGLHSDAVNWTSGQAQIAAGAVHLDHGVHAFIGPGDGVSGAGFHAQRTAYAPVFIDDCHGHGALRAMFGVQGFGFSVQQPGETNDTFLAPWRALVDVGHTAGDGLGIAGAVRVAAALALRLRQGIV